MLAQLCARWGREEEEEERAKNLSMSTTLATIHVVEDLNFFDTHHTPSPSRLTNGIVQTSTLGQTSPPIHEATKVFLGERRENDNIALHNRSPTFFEDSDLNFDNCNLSAVIKLLQRMERDPNTSKLNMPFTEHITNALIRSI